MKRATARLLVVLILVPSLMLAATDSARAANLNDWHKVELGVTEAAGAPGFGVTCQWTSRYLAGGAGVQIAPGGDCDGSIDYSPRSAQPGEPGSRFRAYYLGVRLGAENPPPPLFAVEGDPAALRSAGVEVTIGPNFFRGSAGFTSSIENIGANRLSHSFTTGCLNPLTGGATGDGSSGTGPLNVAEVKSRTVQCPHAASPVGYVRVCARPFGAASSQDYCVTWRTVEPGTEQGPADGEGAGEPCRAVYEDTLTAHERDGTTVWSTIPAGQTLFPASDFGLCQVTDVCFSVIGQTVGGGWDEWWTPGQQLGGSEDDHCAVVEWGEPVVEDQGGTDPAPPAADEVEPDRCGPRDGWTDVAWAACQTAETVKDGFAKMIGWLKRLFDLLAQIVAWLVGLPDLLLDLFSDLFVPSEGAFGDSIARVSDEVSGGSLGEWREAVSGGRGDEPAMRSADGPAARAGAGGGYRALHGQGDTVLPGGIVPSSGCAGPTVSWDGFEKVGLSPNLSPLDACSGKSRQLARWCHLLLTVVISIGGLVKIVDMLTISVGAAKQSNIMLSHDWSGAVRR